MTSVYDLISFLRATADFLEVTRDTEFQEDECLRLVVMAMKQWTKVAEKGRGDKNFWRKGEAYHVK